MNETLCKSPSASTRDRHRVRTLTESVLYRLSDRFHGFLFQQKEDAEPVLVIDQTASSSPRRLFCVRYIVGQGAGGESSRPIFRSELTAYDYETKTMYPTQKVRLERLQAVMEYAMYGQSETLVLCSDGLDSCCESEWHL